MTLGATPSMAVTAECGEMAVNAECGEELEAVAHQSTPKYIAYEFASWCYSL